MKKQKQTDNRFLAPKLLLRKYFVEKYFGQNEAAVCDCCAGDKVVWGNLLCDFPKLNYVGFDVKHKRYAFRIDSARILDLPCSFDVVDIDTYGEPWKHYFNMLKNNAKDFVVVFLTIGFIRAAGGGNSSLLARKIFFGAAANSIPRSYASDYIFKNANFLIAKAFDYQYDIIEAQEAFPEENARYIGVALRRKK